MTITGGFNWAIQTLLDLLKQYPDDLIEIRKIKNDFGKWKNDGPNLIDPDTLSPDVCDQPFLF
jgi:hypothetical protein